MTREKTLLIFIAVVLLLTISLQGAMAQNRGADQKDLEKIQYIEKTLDDGKMRARLWWYSWITVYTGLTVGQFTIGGLLYQDRDVFGWERQKWVNYTVGGTKAALGLGMLFAFPFTPAYATNRLARLPMDTPENARKKLIEAERLLELCAKKEKKGRGWLKHVLSVTVNAAGSVIIWQLQDTKDSWKDALISFASGMAVAEAMIWTQPTRAIKDWKAYRSKFYGETDTGYSEYESDWFITLCPGGIAAGAYF